MTPGRIEPAVELPRLYDAGPVDFALLVRSNGVTDDAELADWIETDARLRLKRGLPIELARYLETIPDPATHPVALDAAVEFTLRWFRLSGTNPQHAADRLKAQYPHLAPVISTSAELSQVLLTSRSAGSAAGSRERFAVPCDFGPLESTGRARYELRDHLGEGASGHVYLGVDRRLSDEGHPAWVAIKVLRPLTLDDAERARFHDEAARARRINHPNVVRVHDRGSEPPDIDYIVSDYVDGPHLGKWLEQQTTRPTPREAASLVRRIALGLQAAHAAGLVHCDLKPDNILMTRTGEPRITDFGLARKHSDPAQAAPARPVGNRAFVAPEQLLARADAFTPAADVYALGGILLWLLTGQFPNGQTVDEVDARLEAIARQTLGAADRDLPGLDRDLAAICNRALRVNPAERYQSADSLAADLDAWLNHVPLPWTRPPLSRQAALLLRRKPWIPVVVATFAALAVVSGLLIGASERRRLTESLRASEELAKSQQEVINGARAYIEMAFRKAQVEKAAADWLPLLSVMEAVSGPILKSVGSNLDPIWSARIALVRQHLDEEEKAGRAGQPEYLLWQSALGYWLMHAHDFDEAEKQLTAARNGWRSTVSTTDVWSKYLDQMLRCITVRRAMASGSALTGDTAAAVRAAAADLERDCSVFSGLRRGGNLHQEVLDTLDAAYSPKGLDDPAARDRVRRMARELERPG